MCYHVIGDTLRGGAAVTPGFADRFAARFASEPTVIAPGRSEAGLFRSLGPSPRVWRPSASWVGSPYVTFDTSPTAIAKAREAATVRAAQVRPPAVPLDYLLAHREYSPTAPIEGIGPGLRTAAAISPAIRP